MTAATGPMAVSMITSESTCSEVISLIVPGILFRMLWLIWRSSDLEDENAMEKGRGKVSAYRHVGLLACRRVGVVAGLAVCALRGSSRRAFRRVPRAIARRAVL